MNSPRPQLRSAPHASARDLRAASQCRFVEAAVCAAFDVSLTELRAPTRRTSSVAFARQIAMYLAHVTFGLSLASVARAFGRDRTTAAHACRRVEDSRDDPLVDAVLDAVESACHAAGVAS